MTFAGPAVCRHGVARVGSHGQAVTCEPCSKGLEAHRRWVTKHPERGRRANRDGQLKTKFGITRIEYDAWLKRQHFKCAICRTHMNLLSRSLAVDHDHETGTVRGLLCSACNTALGLIKEDPVWLRAAAKYLLGGAS